MNAEYFLSIGALIISIASIYYTNEGLKTQREHNIKSILPIGDITLGDYENDIFVRIDNNGIGPLIIKKLTVSTKTRKAESIIDLVPDNLNRIITWSDFIAKTDETTIKSGVQLYLIHKQFEENYLIQNDIFNEIEIKKQLRIFLSNLTIELVYTDVYFKNVYTIKRKLDWFGRHQSISNEIKK